MACTALFDSATGFTKHVTMRDVINNYPFPNTFKVLRVSDADIKAAIERSAEYFDVIQKKSPSVKILWNRNLNILTMIYSPV